MKLWPAESHQMLNHRYLVSFNMVKVVPPSPSYHFRRGWISFGCCVISTNPKQVTWKLNNISSILDLRMWEFLKLDYHPEVFIQLIKMASIKKERDMRYRKTYSKVYSFLLFLKFCEPSGSRTAGLTKKFPSSGNESFNLSLRDRMRCGSEGIYFFDYIESLR